MRSRRLTRLVAGGAATIALAVGAYGIVSATAGKRQARRHAQREPRQGRARPGPGAADPRPAGTRRRGSGRHRREPVQVELHDHDADGSEGAARRLLYGVPERDADDRGERHREGRDGARARDDRRNDHRGQQGRRAARERTDRQSQGESSPSSAVRRRRQSRTVRCRPAMRKARDDRRRSDRESRDEAALAAYPGGIVDRVVKLSDGEYEVHNIGVNWPHHIFVGPGLQGRRRGLASRPETTVSTTSSTNSSVMGAWPCSRRW